MGFEAAPVPKTGKEIYEGLVNGQDWLKLSNWEIFLNDNKEKEKQYKEHFINKDHPIKSAFEASIVEGSEKQESEGSEEEGSDE